MPKKVFVSHASEDKEHFVIPLATKLREDGYDAWIDKWEMVGGDRLVQKIEQGITQADVILFILSPTSVGKRWVREEIDMGFIKRVEDDNVRIVPVIIDDLKAAEIPACLRTTIWVAFSDSPNNDNEYKELCNAIDGNAVRPPLGASVSFAKQVFQAHIECSKFDEAVLRLIVETHKGGYPISLHSHNLHKIATEGGMEANALWGSMEYLIENGALKRDGYFEHGGLPTYHAMLTPLGYCIYLTSSKLITDETIIEMAVSMCNSKQSAPVEGIVRGSLSDLSFLYILKRFKELSYILLSEHAGNPSTWRIMGASASFKRAFLNQ